MENMQTIISDLLERRNRIIPIIGDKCFYGILHTDSSEQKNIHVSLQEYIIEKMMPKLSPKRKKKIETSGYLGMSMLMDEYCNKKNCTKISFRKELKKIVKEGIDKQELYLHDSLRDFLAAGKFEVVITTSPFHVIEESLRNLNFYQEPQVFVPNPSGIYNSEIKLNLPSIYNIFGSCRSSSFVLTEEDLLKYLHYLNIPSYENGNGASPLIKYMKEKSALSDGLGSCILMPIGCDNLPNWLFRFLWYPLSPNILSHECENEGGVWITSCKDNDFNHFLNEFRFIKVDDSDDSSQHPTDTFIQLMTEKMNNSFQSLKSTVQNKLRVNWQEEWDIFISYAKEDKKFADIIYNILTHQLNKKVWMDNRLEVGDLYWNAIDHGITHSKRCLFIITDNYLNKAANPWITDKNSGQKNRSGVSEEINKINNFFLNERKDSSSNRGYSIPLILEGTMIEFLPEDNAFIKQTELNGNYLERLNQFEKYKAVNTSALFEHVQALIFNEQNILEILKKL